MDAKMLTKKKVDFVFGRKVRSEMDGFKKNSTCDLCEKPAEKGIKVCGTESFFCKSCYNAVDGGPVLPDGWPEKEEEEEEDAGEMTIYLIVKDMQVGELTGTYYQTYGGGPEGGIYKTREGWYEIDRGWYKPWKLTELESHVIHFNHEYEMGEQDTPTTIRVTYIP
jgi:hypothetical protein